MFEHKKQEHVIEEVDPKLLQKFVKVEIFPEEGLGHKLLRYAPSGAGGSGFSYSKPGMLAGTGLPGTGIVSNIVTGANRRTVSTPGRGGQQQTMQKPEIEADCLLLKTSQLLAINNGRTVLEGIYAVEELKSAVAGANNRYKMILEKTVPKADRENGKYGAELKDSIQANTEKQLEAQGFRTSIGVLTGIDVDKAGIMGGKKFTVNIAEIEIPVKIEVVSGSRSVKGVGKMMLGTYANMFRSDKKNYDDADWTVGVSYEISQDVSITKYDIVIGDKDDKKNNVDIRERMEKFASDVQPRLQEPFNYAFVRTEKEKKLKLSDAFLKDFYA